MFVQWGLLIKLTKGFSRKKKAYTFLVMLIILFHAEGLHRKKKMKPKEVVRLRSLYTILRKGTKWWRSEQTKGRLDF